MPASLGIMVEATLVIMGSHSLLYLGAPVQFSKGSGCLLYFEVVSIVTLSHPILYFEVVSIVTLSHPILYFEVVSILK